MGFPWYLRGKETTCRMQKTQVQPLTQKIPHAAEQLSSCTQLLSPCSRAWELQLLSPHTTATRAGVPWRHAPQREKSPQ